MDQINRKRKNRVRWTVDAEKLLLLHWADSIEELRSAKKNFHIFARLENKFSKRQMNYSAAEIKEKVHNFTNRYKLEKNAVGMTGGSPSSWIHYKEVEEILSGNKAVNFKELMQESIDVEPEDNIGCAAICPSTSSQSQFISSDELAGPSTTPESAQRRKLTHERLIENLEKTSDMFEKEMESMRGVQERMVELTEKAVLSEEKRNDILKEMSENTKSFYKDLINLLNKK